jgi:DNA-binding MarR family transcriptional regulator
VSDTYLSNARVLTATLSTRAEDTRRYLPLLPLVKSLPRKPTNTPPLLAEFHVEATEFLHEVVRVADCLREARAFDGEPALHFGARWQLLRAVERSGGAPTFADLGRALNISRQAARENAIKAAAAGVIELFPTPDDRRTLQVALTSAGRRALEAQRMPQFGWVFTILNGLEPEELRRTNHVLNVIRRRLERFAMEMRAVSGAASARRSRTR